MRHARKGSGKPFFNQKREQRALAFVTDQMREIMAWTIFIVFALIGQSPDKLQSFLILDRRNFIYFLIAIAVVWQIKHFKFLVLFVGNIREFFFHDFRQLFGSSVSVHYQLHEIGRIVLVIKIMEKSSEVWMGKRIFIPGRKFVEGMALLGDVLAQLEFSPHVIQDIF